ncbi:N-acyl-D-amino-acid deacylase family protein [Hyphomonas sp. NPDC076900]|uniref:N-acyl-D-amino-acid deacylase family protein n=1 Tax=unclassified Hyphomonas TaxID=2630699 RepID=UPI003D014AF5
MVEGNGLSLAPGFIDTHSHLDRGFAQDRNMLPATSQGVTTIFVGQDGFSLQTASSLRASLEDAPVAVNVATFSGHNTIRRRVMGLERRAPSQEELSEMAAAVEADMWAGAFGLSTGLIYEPGTFSETDEIIALAKVSASLGGRYASHVRNEGADIMSAMSEALLIGHETGQPVHISHLKIAVFPLWGKANQITALFDEARAGGAIVTADIYPYTYWASRLEALFEDKQYQSAESLARTLETSVPPESLVIAQFDPEPGLEGMTLQEIAEQWSLGPVQAGLRMMQALLDYKAARPDTDKASTVIGTSMSVQDIRTFALWPYTNVGSDGAAGGHPRGHGTFPRYIDFVVHQTNLLTLEQAVHRMSGLSAENMGLIDRGLIREGYAADLVLFDPDRIRDRATIDAPTRLSEGIARVWVNGEVVFEAGEPVDAFPGVFIARPGCEC